MECGGDGAHRAVAHHDAVDGAEVCDLCRGTCKEGFVADIEHFARESLLDYLDAKLLGEDEDGTARDAVEHGVGKGCGVEHAASDEEQILAGAFGEIAVDVECDAFIVAVDLSFHADELGVHVVGAGLGERGHGVGGEAAPTGDADVGALVAGDVFAPGEVGDVDLDGRLEGVDANLTVSAEGDGPDIAGGDAVGFDDIDDCCGELLGCVGQRHAVDFG